MEFASASLRAAITPRSSERGILADLREWNRYAATILAAVGEDRAHVDSWVWFSERKKQDTFFLLTRTIHEDFYCNCRYAAATSLTALCARLAWRFSGFVTNSRE